MTFPTRSLTGILIFQVPYDQEKILPKTPVWTSLTLHMEEKNWKRAVNWLSH